MEDEVTSCQTKLQVLKRINLLEYQKKVMISKDRMKGLKGQKPKRMSKQAKKQKTPTQHTLAMTIMKP